ncbi:MAG: preprotein translocase subunit YajC [Kiritimatiellae bacterium]|nr:preprotein translocase subunit YajC [Kiritimatiellia bacterium]
MLLPLAQAAAPQQGGIGTMLVPMLLIFAIFYFLMVRPQQRKENERQKTIEALRAGARVLFASGLIGTITEVKQNTFVIEIDHGTKVEVVRGAVIRALKDDETPASAE